MGGCEPLGARNQCAENEFMFINTTLNAPLTVAGETLEYVDSFKYLGNVIRKDWSAQKDIKNRLSKARNACLKITRNANLRSVWRSRD